MTTFAIVSTVVKLLLYPSSLMCLIVGSWIKVREELLKSWYSKAVYLGRKYIKGWVKRSRDTIDISFYELRLFLYRVKLIGPCNFLKRNEIYDNILSLVSSS